jgi:hypothetical protein
VIKHIRHLVERDLLLAINKQLKYLSYVLASLLLCYASTPVIDLDPLSLA